MYCDSELLDDRKVQLMVLTGLITCQDYEQTEVYYALSIQLNKGNK
jgi:hypothetical protein